MASVKGGDKLDAALATIAQGLKNGAQLDVGFMEGATYPDGTSVPMVAALNEFGKANQPPRPFMRDAVAKNSEKWPINAATALKANNYDAAAALDLVGEEIVGEVQDSIVDLVSPALSPITIMLRGMRSNDPDLVVTGRTVGEAAERVAAGKTDYGASDKPLVDSSHMLNSVTHKVTKL